MTPDPSDQTRTVNPQQADIIAFLSSPEAHGGAAASRIDTHLSHVFLAGDRAYKVKRALAYDFVDFSTPELRRRACEAEVRINRRTAPSMYLGVVAIYRNEDGPGWRGAGAPVDWAVEMKRFDADLELDRLAARGALEESVIADLADNLARFHLGAERANTREGAAQIGRVIDQLAAALDEQAGDMQTKQKAARWAKTARAEFERWRRLFDARGRHGGVRRCHGDLHLANICMLDGAPAPFDAIEFSQDLANIDILYDIAFASMDLVRYRRGDLANLLLNRYLSVTRDYSGSGLLALFQSMRAAIRAMVLGLPSQPRASAKDANLYFDLALAFLESTAKPRLIAVSGFSGVGKSTLAASLAARLNAPTGAILLQSDVIRKRLRGASLKTRLDDAAYGDAERDDVYRRMMRDARRALRARAPVILDATFLNPAHRRAAETMARAMGADFAGLWLSAPREILAARIGARTGAVSDATIKILERQLENARPPTDWVVIDAGDSRADALSAAMRALALAP